MGEQPRQDDEIRDKGSEWDEPETVEAGQQPVDAGADSDKYAALKDSGRQAFDNGWAALLAKMQQIKEGFKNAPGMAKDLVRETTAQAFTVPARLEAGWQQGSEALSNLKQSAETRLKSSAESFNLTREAAANRVKTMFGSIRERFSGFVEGLKERHATELARKRQEKIDKIMGKIVDLRAERDEKNAAIMQEAYEKVKANRSEYRGPLQEQQQELTKLKSEASGNADTLRQLSTKYAIS